MAERLLNPEQIAGIMVEKYLETPSVVYKAIAAAQDAQTMQWLQEQCQEPKPCEKCPEPFPPHCQSKEWDCSILARWQGRQEASAYWLAKLWEMVDFLKGRHSDNCLVSWEYAASQATEYLASQGIPERT
jgi:hypothetical protein